MWFQGSLYITDPAYIGLRDEWGEIDEDIIVPGLTNNLVKYTGFGDGSWKVYAIRKETSWITQTAYKWILLR